MRGSTGVRVVVAALAVLHFLLHVGLGLGPWIPDLLTIAVLVGARESHVGVGAGIGFVLGLLADAFSLLSFGANTVALTLVGLLGARSRDFFLGDSLLFLVSYLAVGTWLRNVLHWVMAGEGARGSPAHAFLVDAPLEAVYAAVVGTAVVLVTGVWSEKVA